MKLPHAKLTAFAIGAYLWIALLNPAGLSASEIHDAVQANDLPQVRALVAEADGILNVPNLQDHLKTPLIYATLADNAALVAYMLSVPHTDPNAGDDQFHHPLQIAAAQSNLEIMTTLLDHRAALHYPVPKDRTLDPVGSMSPLALAVDSGNIPAIKLMLTHPNGYPKDDPTVMAAVVIAVAKHNVELLQPFLDQNPDLITAPVPIGDYTGLLHVVAAFGDAKTLELLIKKGCAPNTPDRSNKTPFDVALSLHNGETADVLWPYVKKDLQLNTPTDRSKMFERLLCAGAIIPVKDMISSGMRLPETISGGYSLWAISMNCQSLPFFEFLISQGYKGPVTDRYDPTKLLERALLSANLDIAGYLVDHGARLNEANGYQRVPIQTAFDLLDRRLEKTSTLSVPELIEKIIQHDGMKPLDSLHRMQLVCKVVTVFPKQDNSPTIQPLRKLIATILAQPGTLPVQFPPQDKLPVNMRDVDPLHLAIKHNQLAAVQALLDAKYDPNTVSPDRSSPLYHAIDACDLYPATILDRTAIIKALLDAGATGTYGDSRGYTPLHQTIAMPSRWWIVKLLIDKHCDLGAHSARKETPINIFCDRMASCLLSPTELEQNKISKEEWRARLQYLIDHGAILYPPDESFPSAKKLESIRDPELQAILNKCKNP